MERESIVAAGVLLVGDIIFSGGLRIDGEVRGNVRSIEGQAATLVIGAHGCVDGNIEVSRIVIHGLVTGHVHGRDRVELQATARVNCDVEYAAAEILPGAIIQGRLMHRKQTARNEEPRAMLAA